MALAQRVAGPHHAHIKRIETILGVTIREDSTVFKVSGDEAQAKLARNLLRGLTDIAQKREVEVSDIESLLNHAGQTEKPDKNPDIAKIATRKKTIAARTVMQSKYIRAIFDHSLVFGVGPAGTGKTYLAAAYAAAQFEQGNVDRIILTRPAVEAGERLGFLPGDMKEKVDPYLRPIYDALYDLLPAERVERGLQSGAIEIAPLAFMRGRTLSNAVIILDEAQNTTSMQMKMFLTRLGEGSKMIVTGDPTQVDLPSGQTSGLKEALSILRGEDEIGIIEFSDNDIVRHPLVGKIVKAYDRMMAARHRSPDS